LRLRNHFRRRYSPLDLPGSLVVLQPPAGCKLPYMGGIIGQEHMGAPGGYNYRKYLPADHPHHVLGPDSKAARVEYFKQGLRNLVTYLQSPEGQHIEALAFPRLIGCDLARGDWDVYEPLITGLPYEIYIVDYDRTTVAGVNARLANE
jgi:hypothetical protein